MNVLETPYPKLGTKNGINFDEKGNQRINLDESGLGLDDICLEEDGSARSGWNSAETVQIELSIPTDQCPSLGIDVIPERNYGLVIDKIMPGSILTTLREDISGNAISSDTRLVGGLVTRVNGQTENRVMIDTVRAAFGMVPPGPVTLTICIRPKPFSFVLMPIAPTSGIILAPDTTKISSITPASALDLSNAGRWPKICAGDIVSGIGDATKREQIVEKLNRFSMGDSNIYLEIMPPPNVRG